MDFVSWKDRKPLATALKAIYRAVDAKAAEDALAAFEASEWGLRYPAIGQTLRQAQEAAGMGRGNSLLCLPRCCPPDHLYHQRHRGAELKAQASRQGQGPLPQRRCCNQAALSDLEPIRKRVEDAAA
jgi:putative transposase